MTKPFNIPKTLFVQAYKLVKKNKGSAGVDEQSLKDFERNLKDNLYKLWNRMSSGSYFPPPVKAVPIPKKSGGERILGVPTVGDRIAQMVVRLIFEPEVEPHFLADSYGYRPNKSALDAIEVTRKRCWQYDWVLEFDIKGLFDHIPHHLLMKAVEKHTSCKWALLYIKRWLIAPMQLTDGQIVNREAGTPQGGVISPVLSNLFLHYVFDKWMQRQFPYIPWCRYADDGLLHCKTLKQAQFILDVLKERFNSCGLQLHPDKTKIVYCKDNKRRRMYENTSFDFLGYTFRPRLVRSRKTNKNFVSFTPAVSQASKKSMRDKTRSFKWHLRSGTSLEDIAREFNPVIRGWMNYYGRYNKTELIPIGRHINGVLVKWAMRKFKKLRTSRVSAIHYIEGSAKKRTYLFAHWQMGMKGVFS